MSFKTSDHLELEPNMEKLLVPADSLESPTVEQTKFQKKPSTSLFEIINNTIITKHELVGNIVCVNGIPNNIIINNQKTYFDPVKSDLKLVKTKDFQGLYKITQKFILDLDKHLSQEIFRDETSIKHIANKLSLEQRANKLDPSKPKISEMFDFKTEMEIFRDTTYMQGEELSDFQNYLDDSKGINKSGFENEVIFLNTLQSLQFLQNFNAIEVAEITKMKREKITLENKKILQNKAQKKVPDNKSMIFDTGRSAPKEADDKIQDSLSIAKVEALKCLEYFRSREITGLSIESARKMIQDVENLDEDKVVETKKNKKPLRELFEVIEKEEQANRNKNKRNSDMIREELNEYLHLPNKPNINILRKKRPRMMRASDEDVPKGVESPLIALTSANHHNLGSRNNEWQRKYSKTGSSTSELGNKSIESYSVSMGHSKLKNEDFLAKEETEAFVSRVSNGATLTKMNNDHDSFETQTVTYSNIAASLEFETDIISSDNLKLLQKNGVIAYNNFVARERNQFLPNSGNLPEQMVKSSSELLNHSNLLIKRNYHDDSYKAQPTTHSNITTSAVGEIAPVLADNNLHLLQKNGALTHNKLFASPVISIERITKNCPVSLTYSNLPLNSNALTSNNLSCFQQQMVKSSSELLNHSNLLLKSNYHDDSFQTQPASDSNTTTSAAVEIHPVSADNLNLPQKNDALTQNKLFARKRDQFLPISNLVSPVISIERITKNCPSLNHSNSPRNNNALPSNNLSFFQYKSFAKQEAFPNVFEPLDEVVESCPVDQPLDLSISPQNNDSLSNKNSFAIQEAAFSSYNAIPAVVEADKIESPVLIDLDNAEIESVLLNLTQNEDSLSSNNLFATKEATPEMDNFVQTVVAEEIESDGDDVQSVALDSPEMNDTLLNNNPFVTQEGTSPEIDNSIPTVLSDEIESPVLINLVDVEVQSVSLDSSPNNDTLLNNHSFASQTVVTEEIERPLLIDLDKDEVQSGSLDLQPDNDTLLDNNSFATQEARYPKIDNHAPRVVTEVIESHPDLISFDNVTVKTVSLKSTPKPRVVHRKKIDNEHFMGKYIPFVDCKSQLQLVNTFTCKLCAHSTTSRWHLRCHMRVHDEGAPKFQCRHCFYKTKHPQGLVKHQNVHARDCRQTKLECKECGLKIPHEVKKYFCNFCPFETIHKNVQDHHMQVKHGYKAYL